MDAIIHSGCIMTTTVVLLQVFVTRSDRGTWTWRIRTSPALFLLIGALGGLRAINDVRGWWSDRSTGRPTSSTPSSLPLQGRPLQQAVDHRARPGQEGRVAGARRLPRVHRGSERVDRYRDQLRALAERRADGVTFTHLGLVPGFECYEKCSSAWSFSSKQPPATDHDRARRAQQRVGAP